eukprot:8214673-Prorocentrum_lima.AAC.1
METENVNRQFQSCRRTQTPWQYEHSSSSTTTKKDMLLEECKTRKPDILLGVIPTVSALPLSQ